MAVIASAQITLSAVVDVKAVYRYYLLQSSTLTKPSKPTTTPATAPSGWTGTEPSYTAGSTNSLYTVDGTLFSNGTWSWADVQLSSSYEAAKTAYNKAVTAQSTANTASNQAVAAAKTATNYLGFSSAGLVIGDMTAASLGGNVRIDTDSVDIRNGENVLASFSHSETSPLGEARACTNVESSGTDDLNLIAPGSACVRAISNSKDLKNAACVTIGTKSVSIGAGDGLSDAFGSAASLQVDEFGVTVTTGKSVVIQSEGTIQCTTAPFQVHTISVYPSAQRNLAVSWGLVTCSNVKAKNGTMLSAAGGGIRCSRAGKVMVTANVYTQGAGSGSVQAAFMTSNNQTIGGVNTTGTGTTLGFSIAPCVLEVAAGEVIYLYMANWTSAAGWVPGNNDATIMTVWYIE